MSTTETKNDGGVRPFTTISLGHSRTGDGSTINWLLDQETFGKLRRDGLEEFLDILTALTEKHGDALRMQFPSLPAKPVILEITSLGEVLEVIEKTTHTPLFLEIQPRKASPFEANF